MNSFQSSPKVVVMMPAAKRITADSVAGVITQERLQRAAELSELETRIVQERRALLMQIDADISAGAEVETGELTYYRELKAVGKRHSSPVGMIRRVSK